MENYHTYSNGLIVMKNELKINIQLPLTNSPLGGGNQFLRSLQSEFIKRGIYSDLPSADIVLFNSHQNIRNVVKAKKAYPDKLYVHRIDGPIRLYNTMQDMRDGVTNATNKCLADATIFQSVYSRDSNYNLGLKKNDYSTVIYNGVDRTIFYPKDNRTLGDKIKIIACSWSSNMNKGFDIYNYLDNNLDFNKYEMTFVGNTPIEFKNIKHIKPLCSKELADELRKHDIYITGSRNDPCSNSVLEALSCGLPVICRNEGGHPELIKNAGDSGRVFSNTNELEAALRDVENEYNKYSERIIASNICNIADEYIDFFASVLFKSEGKRKEFNWNSYKEVRKALFRWEHERIARILHV